MSGFIRAAIYAALLLLVSVFCILAEPVFKTWFVALSLLLGLLLLVIVKKYLIFAVGIVLYERITTALSRLVDVLSWLLLSSGWPFLLVLLVAFVINVPMYYLFMRGYEVLPEFENALGDLENFMKKKIEWKDYGWRGSLKWVWNISTQRVLKEKWLIFTLGSPLFLDPDWVTIILRKDKKRSDQRDFSGILIPSVAISTIFWTGVCFFGVYGIWSYDNMIDSFYISFMRAVAN
ncbi:MAG: hypothetical protein ACOYS2_00675 [Patescibacteria group bacterium]